MNNNPIFRNTLKDLLSDSAILAYEKYDGKLAFSTNELSASVFTINDSMVKINNNKSMVAYSYTNLKNVITSIQVNYKKVLPESKTYGALKYCRMSESTVTPVNNFTLTDSYGDGNYYSSLLQSAYDLVGEDRPLVIYADNIRDDNTAERLARNIIINRWKPMAVVDIECNYETMVLELFDKVDLSIFGLPTSFQSMIFMVVGVRIVPNISGQEPAIKLKLIEMNAGSIPATVEWENSVAGTLPEYGNNVTTGTFYQGVL